MNCEQVREWTIDYVYGELSDDKRTAFESHCAECAGCREHLKSVQRPQQILNEAVNDQESATLEKISVASVMDRACRQLQTRVTK